MSRLIFIIGPSASGKSTVAEQVARLLGLPLVCMDHYRVKGSHFIQHEGKRVRNFEDPLMWDPNAIVGKLRALIKSGQGFVCEGNHLLRYRALDEIGGTERYYLDIPFATALARRKTRNRGTEPDWSFAQIGQRMTREIVEPQKQMRGVVVLDGTRPTQDIVSQIKITLPA